MSIHRTWEEMPQDGVPVRVRGIDWDDWGVAYFGSAKNATDPAEPFNAKRCWRWCHNDDEITNPPNRWKPYHQ